MNPQLRSDLPPELMALLRRVPELLGAADRAAWFAAFQQGFLYGVLTVLCLWMFALTRRPRP